MEKFANQRPIKLLTLWIRHKMQKYKNTRQCIFVFIFVLFQMPSTGMSFFIQNFSFLSNFEQFPSSESHKYQILFEAPIWPLRNYVHVFNILHRDTKIAEHFSNLKEIFFQKYEKVCCFFNVAFFGRRTRSRALERFLWLFRCCLASSDNYADGSCSYESVIPYERRPLAYGLWACTPSLLEFRFFEYARTCTTKEKKSSEKVHANSGRPEI